MGTEERTQWRLLMSETNLENFFIGGLDKEVVTCLSGAKNFLIDHHHI